MNKNQREDNLNHNEIDENLYQEWNGTKYNIDEEHDEAYYELRYRQIINEQKTGRNKEVNDEQEKVYHINENDTQNLKYHRGVGNRNQNDKRFLKIYSIIVTVIAIAGMTAFMIIYHSKTTNTEDATPDISGIGAKDGINSSDLTNSLEAQAKYSDSEIKDIIIDCMENNKGTLNMLRKIFPENVVVYEANGFEFIPIIDGLLKNEIDNSKLDKLDNGELTYVEGGEVISHKGIDVSKFQGEIDWKKVAASGVEYAIVRVGYRGYGSGAMVADEYAEKNIAGALSEGIKVGAYFFSQAVTKEEAIEEAEFVINIIKKYNITYPVFFDTEEIPNEKERAQELSADDRTEIAITFCERIKKEGYTPAIYANLKWFTKSLDMSKLEEYDKWFAYYDSELYFPYKISMWQYSESGKVDGINGNVDMNISFKEWGGSR